MPENRSIESQERLVIVVDDDPAVCNSLKFALEVEGLTARAYAGGSALLDAADLAACDCFIIDQKMSGMTGLELAEELRKRQITAPMLLITSHPTVFLKERAARSGIPIIEKPLLENTLLEKVREAVGREPQLR
jgi:two-component system, LuxR family, response regulator FixJ